MSPQVPCLKILALRELTLSLGSLDYEMQGLDTTSMWFGEEEAGLKMRIK